MSDTDIHSCGYYCDIPACIKAQRNELRDKLFGEQWVKTYSGGKPNYTQPIEKEWVGLTEDEATILFRLCLGRPYDDFWHAIEAKLKEKNT